eukprot:3807148-Pleurochrysis_carterae.AAC.1
MHGWTMPYKWDRPVATLPVTHGTIRHTCKMTEILQIITPSPGTNSIWQVPIRPNHLAHQQPHVAMRRAAGSETPNHQITAPRDFFNL